MAKDRKTREEEEKREILSLYRRLLRKAKPFLKDDDSRLIRKAFNLSMEAHVDMRRKSGEPYINHPLSVALICVGEIGLGTTSIVAALLHDVVEDTEIELSEIERGFGPKVASIIDGLTKISGVFEYGSTQQAENFRKMLLTLSDDVRVILIKLADRLHNMRTLASMARNKQLKVASETIFLYAPLAHRLGLYAMKSELEDLSLKFTEAEAYKEISSKMVETREARDKFIKKFIRPLNKELSEFDFDFEIKGRPKSVYSIWSKMKKQDIPFEEVYDLFAIRIIVDTSLENEKAACWQVYSVVTDFYQPNPDRLRDWISTPKANGYESLHTTVMSAGGQWVEVQIRTKRMDEIAEKGYAAHWKYKDDDASEESSLEQWINRVRELLEQNDVSSALEFVDDFKGNLFNEEVFVFTPMGDLKRLPHGATALDFAFEIHTEVGIHCLGAKVNQKLVPLHHVLKNGDQVEILTSDKQKPSEDWLRFVVSSKARHRIKEGLKEEKKEIASEGKEIMLRKMKQLKIEPTNENFDKIRAFFNVDNQLDLFYKTAQGFIEPKDLKKFKEEGVSVNGKRKMRVTDVEGFERQLSKIKTRKEDILFIGEDMDLIDYKFAKCCSPIPGDDVFGFVSVNDGIKIHRTSCPNAPELLSNHGHRVVKAKWASKHKEAYTVGLEIIGTDRVGLINDVTKVISNELKVNMRSISVDTDTGIFEGKIVLYINDSKHLDVLITKLEQVSGVAKVKRFDYTPEEEPIHKQA